MESLDSNLQSDNTSFITPEIRGYLSETARWGKFLAIVGYVGIGLILLIAIGVMIMGSSASLPGMGGMNMGALGMIYIVVAGFYFFPVHYLFQFSAKIKQGLNSQDNQDVTTGFENLKSLFKFMGIFMIVILSLYALILLIALAAGAGSLF